MANYNTFTRSNYFKVKEYESFKNWVESMCYMNFDIVEHTDDKGTYALLSEDLEGASMISGYYFDEGDYEDCDDIEGIKKELNVDKDGCYEVNVAKGLAEHLVDGEVAILMEIGKEKMRYLSGFAIAVNNKGETREVTINSIYEMAEELGHVTNEAVW